MWVFSAEKVEEFLGQLAAGFQRGPLEVALFFVMLVVVIGGPLLLSFFSVRRRRGRARAEAIARFDAAVAARNLSLDETEAVAALARAFSPDPARWPSVLTRAAAFNTAAARGGVEPALLARLRVRLQLQEAGLQVRLHSTVELEPGAPVFIVEGPSTVRGRVAAVDESSFEVRAARPVQGTRLTLRIPRPTGLYNVEAPVLAAQGTVLRLSHAEVSGHIQNRRFVRRRVRGTATVTRNDGSSFGVRLVDLGGGGARVEGPLDRIQGGDEVTLSVGKPGGWHAVLPSRVVRTLEDGFSLVFVDVPDAQRDDLIRRLR